MTSPPQNACVGKQGYVLPSVSSIEGIPDLPARVASLVSGGRDQWSAPMAIKPDDPVEGLATILNEVLDPEIPISLIELGLIYAIRYENGTAHIDLSFTATACPCMSFIKQDVNDRLMMEDWVQEVEIHEVWDPPWTVERISDVGRKLLKTLGVGA